MALLLNATRRMQDSVVLTNPSYKGRYPQNTRDAIQIAKAHKSGIFQIEQTGARKGTNFDNKTEKEIADVQKWLENYPRRMFGYKSSKQLFLEEMKLLI